MRTHLVLVLCVLISSASSAWAHKLKVECKLIDKQLFVEAFYADASPATNAKVAIWSGANDIVDSGKTNESGTWSTKVPEPGTYSVVVESVGHKTKTELTIQADQAKIVEQDSTSSHDHEGFPWRNVMIGLGIIGIGALAWSLVHARRPKD